MAAFSLRDNWGVGAAAGIAVSLCVGGWAYASMNHHRGEPGAALIRPKTATAGAVAPATLDIPAGGATKTPAAPSNAPTVLVVHVTGSVKKPGVYRLKLGDRINDAIIAAGGFKANARQDVLNLADTVRDADQIFVPSNADLAPKKSSGGVAAETAYAAPEVRAPRHPLIVRGTPVRTALASASASQNPVPVSTVSETAAAPNADEAVSSPPAETNAAPSATAPDEPPTSQPVPEATPGRVLGKPAPVDKGGEVVEEDGGDPQVAPAAAPGSGSRTAPARSRTGSTRRSSGSVSKTGGSGKSGGSGGKFKNPGDGIVHLNSATAPELEKLPGVGPAMSARILEYRRQINGFRNIEQILDVKGIGDKKFAKMRPFLAL